MELVVFLVFLLWCFTVTVAFMVGLTLGSVGDDEVDGNVRTSDEPNGGMDMNALANLTGAAPTGLRGHWTAERAVVLHGRPVPVSQIQPPLYPLED